MSRNAELALGVVGGLIGILVGILKTLYGGIVFNNWIWGLNNVFRNGCNSIGDYWDNRRCSCEL
jgi:hypothetical protein